MTICSFQPCSVCLSYNEVTRTSPHPPKDDDIKYYEWDYNPYLVDEGQADVHKGVINRAQDIETLLFRINMYKKDIKKIKAEKPNPNF